MNDAGLIAGTGFVYNPAAKTFVSLDPASFPTSINSDGDVVGMIFRGTIDRGAFLYVSETGLIYDLLPVLGTLAGVAGSINDRRQILGYGFDPNNYQAGGSGPPQFGGITLRYSFPVKINNAGEMMANAASGDFYAGGLLYTPARGLIHLPGMAIDLNNSNQLLLQNGSGQYSIYNTSSGAVTPIAPAISVPFEIRRINDNGEYIGVADPPNQIQTPFYASTTFGGALLRDLIPPDSGWTLESAIAINNRGQILVEAFRGDRDTTLLLTPQ